MTTLAALLKDLAIAAGTAAAKQVVRAVRAWVSPAPDPGESTPLTHAAVEHNRRQERAAIEASKRAEAERAAAAPGKLRR